MPMGEPEVGQRFPSIALETAGYKRTRVPDDYRGRNVVLSWFPYAFSPVCTEELRGFAKAHEDLAHHGATVLAASCDHWYTNEAYKASLQAPYPFASDWHRTEARKLGIFDEAKARSGRSIYLIDREGVLRWKRHYEIGACPRPEDFLPELRRLS